MPDAGAVPLTFGQLSVWRVMAQWPPDRWVETYLSTAARVPDGCPAQRVVEAFGILCRRHESLRTHFVDTPHGPVQYVRPDAGPAQVATVECAGATRAEAQAAARGLTRERIERERDFARRFILVTDRGRPSYAVLVTDHILADGFALRRLRGELTALLGGDDPDGQRWLDETPAQPRELALDQHSEANGGRRQAALDHWRRLLDTLPATLFPVPDEAGHHPGRIEAVLRSPGTRAALGSAAQRLAVPPQGVLLALNSLALATVTGTSQVVLTLQSSNRFTAPWRTLVSSMNQYAPLALDLGAAPDTFAEHARQVQADSFRAYWFGSYDIDAVTALVRAERGITLGFDHFYNFMAQDVPTDEAADALVDRTSQPPLIEPTRPNRQIGPRFDLKVYGGPDLPIHLRADPLLLPQPRLHTLLAWFDEELHRLATDPATRVAEVLARCEAALGPAPARHTAS